MFARDRFWRFVKIGGDHECWEWGGAKSNKGYGRFWVGAKMRVAPRVAYVLANVEIPDGAFVLHTCDNPGCVNPNHLYVGTLKDNHRDMVARNRAPAPHSLPGETNPQARLTREQVVEIKERYQAGGVKQAELAKEYGVTQSLISGIIRGVRWAHVK